MRTSWLTIIYSLIFATCACLVGCDKGTKKNFGEPPNFQITSNTEINYLTVYYYALPACARCHIDAQSPNLSTYKSLTSEIESVQDRIASNDMPPSDQGYEPLSACQKLVLSTWISRGMPTKGGSNLGAPGNACY
jgi:hypothetical protein